MFRRFLLLLLLLPGLARARDLAFRRPLRGGTDVDQERVIASRRQGFDRGQTMQAAAGSGEQALDAKLQ